MYFQNYGRVFNLQKSKLDLGLELNAQVQSPILNRI